MVWRNGLLDSEVAGVRFGWGISLSMTNIVATGVDEPSPACGVVCSPGPAGKTARGPGGGRCFGRWWGGTKVALSRATCAWHRGGPCAGQRLIAPKPVREVVPSQGDATPGNERQEPGHAPMVRPRNQTKALPPSPTFSGFPVAHSTLGSGHGIDRRTSCNHTPVATPSARNP